MERIEKEKKRAAKKEREIKQKFDLRQKMSVIATTTAMDNDEELHLPNRVWEDLHKKGFEGLENESDESSGSDESDLDEESSEEEVESDDSEVDDKVKAINKMAEEMEENISK